MCIRDSSDHHRAPSAPGDYGRSGHSDRDALGQTPVPQRHASSERHRVLSETRKNHEIPKLEAVKAHPQVAQFLSHADSYLAALGYTEHGTRHASLVAHIAHNVLERLGYPDDTSQLAAVAGYPVSYTHLRAHETVLDLVCRLLLEKKK